MSRLEDLFRKSKLAADLMPWLVLVAGAILMKM
jgi:hypothetical protein